jgi:leucyl aminopeptidase
MNDSLLLSHVPVCIPLILIPESESSTWLEQQDASLLNWLTNTGFEMKAGNFILIPGSNGSTRSVVICIKNIKDIWTLGRLPAELPSGNYELTAIESSQILESLTVGWALGAYQFTRYKKPRQQGKPRLLIHPACDSQRIQRYIKAVTLVRDLINTPASDMMPEHLAEIIISLSREFGAAVNQIIGDDLLLYNYPVIHAVGRASAHLPQLIDLHWGNPAHPKVTVVGKGVCFDSGGLNLKTAHSMRLMKKDMGGAATAIGLSQLIMSSNLPVQLRLLIAAVENAVSSNACRPGDVLCSRQGLTIEVQNTDAEGRLILCDALTEASSAQPEFLFDFATLTSAARIALGTDVSAMFCNDEALASGLLAAAEREQEPIWRLPLHQSYKEMLKSKIADISNATESPYAGAITAALFLQEFVPNEIPWAHFDLMSWNLKTQPGRPEGGEAMAMRSVFSWLEKQYGQSEL